MHKPNRDDLWVTAQTLWAEARGEPFEGQVAVAWVIRSRIAHYKQHRAKVASYAGICLAPKQFSCWNADDPQRARLDVLSLDDSAFASALKTVIGVMSNALGNPVPGARWYHADYMRPPAWTKSLHLATQIGRHLFYVPKETHEHLV